jgi:hypothetical protein
VTIRNSSNVGIQGVGVVLNYTTNTGSTTGITPAPGTAMPVTDVNGVTSIQLRSTQNVIVTLSATATNANGTITLAGPAVTFGTGGTPGTGTATGNTVVVDCIQIPADNIRAATITVTLRNGTVAVPGKTVVVSGSPVLAGMTLQPASAVTDANGAARFTVRSTTVGGPVTFTATNQTDAQTIAQTVQVTFAAVGSNPCVPAPTAPGTLPGVAGGSPADGVVIIYALCIRTGPGFAYSRYAKALPFRTAVRVLGRTTRIPGLGPRDKCIKKGGPTWYFIQLQNGATVWANASYIRLNDRNAFRTLPVLPQPPAPGTFGAAPSGAPIGEPVPSAATATPRP